MKKKHLLFVFMLAACLALTSNGWAQQSPPTNVQAAPGNQSAAVSFQAPAGDNGSSITGYTVTAKPSAGADTNAGTTSLLHVVTGLANGTAYTFTVTATNSSNEISSASSASNSVTPSDNAYDAYAGIWHDISIVTGLNSPYGQTMTKTVKADGSFTLVGVDSNNNSIDTNCSAWLFPYGMTGTCDTPVPPNILWYLNPADTVATCTGTINGGAYFGVSIKEASTPYSISSDLPGEWNYQGLEIATGGDQWSQANVSISSSGNMSGLGTNSNGKSNPVSGAFSLSSTGQLSCTSGNCSGDVFWMDPGKSVAAGLKVFDPDDIQLAVLGKQAASYSKADLVGYWDGSQVRTDGSWRRILVQVNSDGSFTKWQTDSNGAASSGTGNLAISSTGAVSCSGSACNNDKFVMDASKTVMTETKTNSAGNAYVMQVYTKAKTLWPTAVDTGNNWMWVDWLGSFNPSSAPWIYHQTLGWLYTVGDGTPSDGIWFYDPQWNSQGGWWWTSSSLYPWLYSATENGWLYYDAAASSPHAFQRWFFSPNGNATTH